MNSLILRRLEIDFSEQRNALEIVDLCVNNNPTITTGNLPNELIKMIFDQCQSDLEKAGLLLHEPSSTRKLCLLHSGKKDSSINPQAHRRIAELILKNDVKDLLKDFCYQHGNVEFWGDLPFNLNFNHVKFILQNKNFLDLPTLNDFSGLTQLYCDQLYSLPTEIGNFKNLTYLNVRTGFLKSLPRSIGQLSKLEDLDVSHNKLEKIPDEICDLKELRYLWLNDNQLTELPQKIGDLNLITLTIEYNKITILPYSMRKLIDKKCGFDYVYSNNNVLKLMPDLYSKIQYKVQNSEILFHLMFYCCFSIPFLSCCLLQFGREYWHSKDSFF